MKKLLLMVLLVLFISAAYSQEMKTRNWRKSQLDSLASAEMMFEDQNFVAASSIYDQIQQEHPTEMYLKYKTGICALFRSDMHLKALTFLTEVYAKNHNAEDIQYYLARAEHYNYHFDEAIALMDEYMKSKLNGPQKRNALQLKEYCINTKKLVSDSVHVKIENVSAGINTNGAEYVPLVSSDESLIIYTYRGEASTGGLQNEDYQPDKFGEYYEDVFSTQKINGEWSKPAGISAINTKAHEAAIGLSNDGQKLFIFKDDERGNGDIYMSRLDSSGWSIPEKLRGDINTNAWEGSASVSADEKTLYFSSERPGGLGGKDIYKASLQANGSWGNVENLGPAVNTEFDDDAPFIHPDGKTLLFSSKGRNSMGGYDIFSSVNKNGEWTTAKNIGYPVNTPDDDVYFVLSADGNRGYYSSGKSGGKGEQDIYIVDMPSDYEKPVVAMIKGHSMLDDKPVQVGIEVVELETNSVYGTFSSNGSNGNYLINLVPGHSYQITYKLKDLPDQVEIVDLRKQNSFMEKNIEINFSVTNTVARKD